MPPVTEETITGLSKRVWHLERDLPLLRTEIGQMHVQESNCANNVSVALDDIKRTVKETHEEISGNYEHPGLKDRVVTLEHKVSAAENSFNRWEPRIYAVIIFVVVALVTFYINSSNEKLNNIEKMLSQEKIVFKDTAK